MSTHPHEEPIDGFDEGAAPEHHGGHSAGHGGHGGHKKGHGGGDHGGGGHGGSWIVTYSDMITLLMAFFICIITFASRETEKYQPKKDSLMGEGGGGSGIASSQPRGALERDSVVWRLRIAQARVSEHGAEMAPIYQDPSLQTSAQILRALEEVIPGRLRDDFAVRLPLSLLFEEGGQLSSSGVRLLHALAVNLRDLPYDLQFQASGEEQAARAVQVCAYLASQEGCEPARLAVGGRPPRPADADTLWLVLSRQF